LWNLKIETLGPGVAESSVTSIGLVYDVVFVPMKVDVEVWGQTIFCGPGKYYRTWRRIADNVVGERCEVLHACWPIGAHGGFVPFW
jgi:hypothetical protein